MKNKFKVISKDHTEEQLSRDLPKIKAVHEEAMKDSGKDALWQFFGGVVKANGNDYQICPEGENND